MLISMVILISDLILDFKKSIEKFFKAVIFVQYLFELFAVIFAKIAMLAKYKIDMGFY